jgi:hypothetical protein
MIFGKFDDRMHAVITENERCRSAKPNGRRSCDAGSPKQSMKVAVILPAAGLVREWAVPPPRRPEPAANNMQLDGAPILCIPRANCGQPRVQQIIVALREDMDA